MTTRIVLDDPLTPDQIVSVAKGAWLDLSDAAILRIRDARAIVESLVARGERGYGINTGVGALCDVVISPENQSALSHSILFSHACGVGEPLECEAVRAIMASQINNYSHGKSGIAWETVDILVRLLNAGMTPRVPSRGSVGYLSHTASIGLAIIGVGELDVDGKTITAREALAHIGREPRILAAKEGLSLVNGTTCATGIAALAHARLSDLLNWADAASAMSYSVLARQPNTFAGSVPMFRHSSGVRETTANLKYWLGEMHRPKESNLSTQDPLSLRAIPQVHGAIRDELDQIREILTLELNGVSDNPTLAGTPEAPEVFSQANAVGASVAFAADRIAIAGAQLGAISERRIDRLVNPLVSGLPAFLSADNGTASGFMTAQYTATSLVNENRMLAAPASLGNGITSALQEDILTHATPAAEQALRVIANIGLILSIELLCGAQARDLHEDEAHSPRLRSLYDTIRDDITYYANDRPLNGDIEQLYRKIASTGPPVL